MKRNKLSLVYHPKYDVPLPAGHRFTSSKFSDLFNELTHTGLIHDSRLIEPKPATEDELLLTHDKEYISKIKTGNLLPHEERRLGLPWTKELMERSFLAANGTYLTAVEALKNGIACHLAGGTHHSHYNFGSGFCVFNDLAYTSLKLIKLKYLKRVLIFDCDVHRGDGTASILEHYPDIFTCSIHCRKNFPARKMKSDLDVQLEDHIEDNEYLKILKDTLERCLEEFRPDIVIYDAGVDVAQEDSLGRLDLSIDGILERDTYVLNYFRKLSIPVATVIGGGYSQNSKELAQRHSQIFRAAYKVSNMD